MLNLDAVATLQSSKADDIELFYCNASISSAGCHVLVHIVSVHCTVYAVSSVLVYLCTCVLVLVDTLSVHCTVYAVSSEGFGTLEALQGCWVQGGREVTVVPVTMMMIAHLFEGKGFNYDVND